MRPRHPRLRAGGKEVRVKRENRAGDDGYRSALLPGLRASGDAEALAQEIAFAHGRLLALGAAPPDLYGEVRALAEENLELATWTCFLVAYLSPLDGENPFLGIRLVLAAASDVDAYEDAPSQEDALEDLGRMPLGSAYLARSRTGNEHAAGLPSLGRARRFSAARVRGRSRVESATALRAELRAPGAAGLRANGTL